MLGCVVGDLHGDLDKARYALQMAGVLSSDGEDLWTGGDSILVQLGDILDRGDDEIAILSLLRSLDIQAKANSGAVFQVIGNHETLNVEEDFQFVVPGAFDECADFLDYLNDREYDDRYKILLYGDYGDWDKVFVGWCGESRRRKEKRRMSTNKSVLRTHIGELARTHLFRPGGLLACELARHPVALKVNDWIFCHGGLLPHHVSYGLERMNMEVSEWMKDFIWEPNFIGTKGEENVVWNTWYSTNIKYLDDHQISRVSDTLEETLQAVGAKAMVVGHVPQHEGANCEYNSNVWRIDVGMSRGVLNSRPEVLEIRDDGFTVIRDDQEKDQKESIQ